MHMTGRFPEIPTEAKEMKERSEGRINEGNKKKRGIQGG